MIISLVSQKGGVGKSTIATNLAGGYACNGLSVMLVDADPQKTSYRWAKDRKEEKLPEVASRQAKGDIAPMLSSFAQDYQIVLADTPGRDSKEMISGLSVADIAIMPLYPSQPDMDTIETLVINIAAAKKVNSNLKAYILLTRVATHPKNTEKDVALDIIKGYKTLAAAKTLIHDRKGYRDAISEGRCVIEIKAGKAQQEIISLAKEIQSW
ncbi:MAG: AAA family ATPase [Candidatus Portiera sp.]|nr:AAA family ATPase [Portiera sp.]